MTVKVAFTGCLRQSNNAKRSFKQTNLYIETIFSTSAAEGGGGGGGEDVAKAEGDAEGGRVLDRGPGLRRTGDGGRQSGSDTTSGRSDEPASEPEVAGGALRLAAPSSPDAGV
jgi:hypothetical protein